MRSFTFTFALAVTLLLSVHPERSGAAGPSLPITRESPRILIRAEDGLARQAARLLPRAERALARIERDLDGLPRVERVEVRLVKHAEDLAAVAPPGRGAPRWAAGVAWPREGVVAVAARGTEGSLLDMDQILAHELAHMALDHALDRDGRGGDYPRWLTEGFAYLHSADASWGRAATLFSAVMRGDVIPLDQLDARFPAREDEVSLAYAESYDFVAFLARRGRYQDEADDGDRSAFRQFLAELAAGAPANRAALAAFGRALPQLEAEWQATLTTRYLWYPMGLGGALLWCLAAFLLVLAWRRRRRLGRLRMKQWDLEDAIDDAARLRDQNRLN